MAGRQWRRAAWEGEAPAPAPSRDDPNAGLLRTSFREGEELLTGETAEDLIAELGDWLIDPSTPPDRGPRVSRKLAAGGEPGRWLVIWGKGNAEGPWSKDVATKALQARRKVSPGSLAWMLNVDRMDLRMFDEFCMREWVYPWLAKYHYFNAWQDQHGEVRTEGPRNLIEAKAYWLAHTEAAKTKGSNVRNPWVFDIRTGLPLFPKNYGAPPKTRTNPGDRTPAVIRHMVVAIAPAVADGDPGIDDAALVSAAHAFAWSAAQRQGWVTRGTSKLTAAGQKRDRQHAAEPDAAAKDARYEALLHDAREARSNPTGQPFSGRAEVKRGKADVPEAIPFRGLVRDRRGNVHRPRTYLDPLDPLVQQVVAGQEAMRELKRIIAHRDESGNIPQEIEPAKRSKKRRRTGA